MTTTTRRELLDRCVAAREASRQLATVERAQKDAALRAIGRRLRAETATLLEHNARDLAAARANALSPAMVDRLALDAGRIDGIAAAVEEVAALPDPVGEVVGMSRRPNGLLVGQVRIPLGVIAMIYESRPNVTVDAAALTLKSGNAVLLRGGKEAHHSNRALGEVVRHALDEAGLSSDAVQILPPLSRDDTRVLLGLSGHIDLLIPRGGEGLIRFVTEHARVPVVQHYKGVVHVYVDASADLDMAAAIVENAKLSRTGVCNALEGLLVDEAVADAFLPRLGRLVRERGLEVRGDARVVAAVPEAKAATDEDWGTEFLAPILAARVVSGLDSALAHIARHGSGHTEAIVTESYPRAQRFLREVDASCVLVNASPRFNDGGMLGLGAEIGISTTKLHAYGPMGLAHLTTLKWTVQGTGQVR
ncbi:MAG: glutamate-5-semialdehyde dehydrogenase [Myxococcota bacterium]